MNADELRAALDATADHLRGQNVTARVYIVGGAAIALAYDGDRVTRDIDGLILEGHGPLTEAVRVVGRQLGLPGSWLNEQASAYLPTSQDRRGIVVFDNPSLRVIAASADRLLAMKVRSARQTDLADIILLTDHLGLRTPEDVFAVVRTVFPDDPVPERGRLIVEDLLAESPTSS